MIWQILQPWLTGLIDIGPSGVVVKHWPGASHKDIVNIDLDLCIRETAYGGRGPGWICFTEFFFILTAA